MVRSASEILLNKQEMQVDELQLTAGYANCRKIFSNRAELWLRVSK